MKFNLCILSLIGCTRYGDSFTFTGLATKHVASSLRSSKNDGYSEELSRRTFLNKASTAAAAGVASVASVGLPKAALADDSDDPYADYTTTESGLKYKVTKEGTGAVPTPGQTVKVSRPLIIPFKDKISVRCE